MKLADLVALTADTTAWPTPSVSFAARLLRQAGFVAKAGRGPNAATMREADAAALLMGMAGAEGTMDALAAFKAFRGLRPYAPETADYIDDCGVLRHADLAALLQLFGTADAGQVMEELIRAGADGRLARLLLAIGWPLLPVAAASKEGGAIAAMIRDPRLGADPSRRALVNKAASRLTPARLSIDFRRPNPGITLRIDVESPGQMRQTVAAFPFLTADTAAWRRTAFRTDTTTIDALAFLAIGEALAADPPSPDAKRKPRRARRRG